MSVSQIFDLQNKLLAIVVRNSKGFGPGHNFLTGPDKDLQFAIFNHPAGHVIPRHRHLAFERQIESTSEVLIIDEGRLLANIFDSSGSLVESLTLDSGDVLILLSGGHGFEMLTSSRILEVKQGPYVAELDKELF